MIKRVIPIAVVVVALVAATIGGLWWGRTTTTASTTPTSPAANPATATPSTSGRTYPATSIPVGTVIAGQGGTRQGPGNLQLGYPHTPDGAVAALTNYLTAAFDGTHLADPTYRTAIVDAIALDDTAKVSLTRGVELYAGPYGCAVFKVCAKEPRRGAYAIRSYALDRAEIALFIPSVMAQPTGKYKAQTTWGTGVGLVFWNGSDWKIRELGADGVVDDTTSTVFQEPADPWGNPSNAEKAAILTAPTDGTVRLFTLNWMEYANAVH